MKKLFLASLMMLLFLFGQIFASADSWIPPTSFEIESKDGSKVFRFEPNSNNHSTAVLYDNSNPPKAIYTVENLRSWAYENNFFFSDDLMHFFFIPPADFDIALEFYSKGKLKKTYYIKDLVKDHSKISYSISSAWWLKEGVKVSQDNNTLTLTTVDNLTYNFDITDGNILGNDKVPNPVWNVVRKAIPFVLTGALIAGYIASLLLRRRQKSYLLLFH